MVPARQYHFYADFASKNTYSRLPTIIDMTNKAILVVHSENIILKTTEMDKKPIFVQCPRVTNMANGVFL